MAESETVDTGLDVSAIAESIGNELFPATPDPPTTDAAPAEPPPVTPPTEAAGASAQSTPQASQPIPAPKSFREDLRAVWDKIPPEAQSYYLERESQLLKGMNQYKSYADFQKSFHEAVNPYRDTLKRLGVDELTAMRKLFSADHALRYSPPEQKVEYIKKLAKEYGIDLTGAQQAQTPVDPVIQQMRDELATVKHTLTAREQAEQQAAYEKAQAAYEKAAKEVEAFASDKEKHPYFNEVQDHIVMLIQGMKAAGKQVSLQDAYDQAVWANPVTRAKELARAQTEYDAKLKENARLEALPKKKAAALNVNSRETKRTPTEPLGTMEDTIKTTLRSIKERVH